MSEWQPIETAPKDDSILVCYTETIDGENHTECWVDFINDSDWWEYYPHTIRAAFPPTHWMPLPEPPNE